MNGLFGGWRPPSPGREPEPPVAPWVPNYEQAYVLDATDKLLVQCEAALAALRAAKQETA